MTTILQIKCFYLTYIHNLNAPIKLGIGAYIMEQNLSSRRHANLLNFLYRCFELLIIYVNHRYILMINLLCFCFDIQIQFRWKIKWWFHNQKRLIAFRKCKIILEYSKYIHISISQLALFFGQKSLFSFT